MPNPLRILIVDDHAVMREGLKLILQESLPGAVFGEAGSAAQTLDRLAAQSWDALVLDLFLPDCGGLDLLNDVRRKHPSVPVLVLSSAPEEQLAISVMRAGASGYLNKQAVPEDIVKAVRAVIAGEKFASRRLMDRLLQERGAPIPPAREHLTNRELQVMQSLAAGKRQKEIAAELGISVKTVRTFRTRLLKKLGVQNDVEMLHYALKHHLVRQSPP
jgi:DNA-binding NarL/FixJ family response regulator